LTPTLTTEHRPLNTEICSPLAVLSLDRIPTYITQPFIQPSLVHNAEHPDWVRKDDGHHGVDIGYYQINGKLFTGTPVLAALDGKIAAIVHDRPPYGNMLIVETPFERIPPALVASQGIAEGDSLYSLYAHLQALQALTIGQPISCGQQLAETGLTGFTGGPHLHFETRWGPPGRTFASMAYYRADATSEEMDNYETWRMTAVFHLFDPMELLAFGIRR
jgi:murein DD-endopeptidase MepM/ murein hydrolase activator NlpD